MPIIFIAITTTTPTTYYTQIGAAAALSPFVSCRVVLYNASKILDEKPNENTTLALAGCKCIHACRWCKNYFGFNKTIFFF